MNFADGYGAKSSGSFFCYFFHRIVFNHFFYIVGFKLSENAETFEQKSRQIAVAIAVSI